MRGYIFAACATQALEQRNEISVILAELGLSQPEEEKPPPRAPPSWYRQPMSRWGERKGVLPGLRWSRSTALAS